MSAIHEAARTVEQAAQAEEAKLAAILEEAQDLQHQIDATEERLRNLRTRLATVTEDLTEQRLANEQAGKLAEVARRLNIKAAPDHDSGEQYFEHLAHAATDRTKSFPAIQVAKPVEKDNTFVCDWADCGQALVGSDVEGWVHVRDGRVECKPEPAATTRTDDPLRLQELDPAEVREAVNGSE